tara:strand:+ start:6266 stop:6553 length:288 start_codon:yes stop_codon:yes gene_type:complete
MKPFEYKIYEDNYKVIYEDNNNLIIIRMGLDMYSVQFGDNKYHVYADTDKPLFIAKYYIEPQSDLTFRRLCSTPEEEKMIIQLLQMTGMLRPPYK